MSWRKQIFEVQTWRQVRELQEQSCTRDLGMKWPIERDGQQSVSVKS